MAPDVRRRAAANVLKATFRVPPFNTHNEGSYAEEQLEWRRIGARGKAQNIGDLLGGEQVGEVLEVGCGTGALLDELRRCQIGSGYIGVDIADPGPHSNVSGIRLEEYDGEILPFADDSFDLVIASHVVEHVLNPRGLLVEMRRVSSRFVYVEVPCELTARVAVRTLEKTLEIGHINSYTPESFQLLLETSRLQVRDLWLFDHGLETYRWNSSRIKAHVKRAIRSIALSLSPRVACRLFTYHCGALCLESVAASNGATQIAEVI